MLTTPDSVSVAVMTPLTGPWFSPLASGPGATVSVLVGGAMSGRPLRTLKM